MRLLRAWATKGEAETLAELEKTPRQVKRNEPPAQREVLQHFLAANLMCEKSTVDPLTEDLIKQTHKVLMDGLLDEDGQEISILEITALKTSQHKGMCLSPLLMFQVL